MREDSEVVASQADDNEPGIERPAADESQALTDEDQGNVVDKDDDGAVSNGSNGDSNGEGDSGRFACVGKSIDNDEDLKFNFFMLIGLIEVIGIVMLGLMLMWLHLRGGFAWDGSGQHFNWHPLFMSLGMIYLYGNALIVYRVLRQTPKFQQKVLHGCLQTLVFMFSLLGLVAVFQFHNHNNIPNLYSLHSWLGIATVFLFFCQLLVGGLAFLYPRFSDEARKMYLNVHVYFGVGIFLLAIMTALTGITEKLFFSISATYASLPVEGRVVNVLGLTIVGFTALVLVVVLTPAFKPRSLEQQHYYSLIGQ